MTVRVLGLASGTTGLEDHRHAIAALVMTAGSVQARGGLFVGAGGDLVSVAAMQAKVTPHYAWVDGTAALEAGYDLTSDADVLLTFDPGEPGVARIDRVIDRVRNNPYDASGATAGSVEILKGQASGAATALPPNSELLWEVTVPAGASAGTGGINFTTARVDKRRWTVASGGLLPARNQAERDAIAAPYAGMPIWRIDRKWVEAYDGAGWRVQGIGTVASAADRAAVTSPYDGQVIARSDRDWLEQYDGAAWRVVGTAAVAVFADLATYITNPYLGQIATVAANSGGEYRYNGTAWLRHPGESEIRRVASFVIASGANLVVIPFDDEGGAGGPRDPLGVWSAANPTRLIVPAGMDGRWEYEVLNLQWPFNAAGSRVACWTKNGLSPNVANGNRLGQVGLRASDSTETNTHPKWVDNMAAGEFVELWGSHNAGGNMDVAIPPGSFPLPGVRVRARRIGPAL